MQIRNAARRLKLTLRGDRHAQELTFAKVLEDSSGNYIAGKLSVMDLLLSRATLNRLCARSRCVEAVENRFATLQLTRVQGLCA